MELNPDFWNLVDHLWWFFLGGLGVLVVLVALVYCHDWKPPDEPPDAFT